MFRACKVRRPYASVNGLGGVIGGFFRGRIDWIFKMSATTTAELIKMWKNNKYFSQLREIIHVQYKIGASASQHANQANERPE